MQNSLAVSVNVKRRGTIYIGLPWWLRGKEYVCNAACGHTAAAAASLQSWPTLCDPIDGVLSLSSCVRLFVTQWTVAHQAPLSMGFSRQEDWSGLPCPPPGDLPNPRTKSTSLPSPVLASRLFTTRAPWEDPIRKGRFTET